MKLDQINSLAMNCDLKNNMELQARSRQGSTALYPACDRELDSIFCSREEDEFSRLAGLSSAPIYAFDEDGDILPQSHPFTPHNSVGSAHDMSPSTTQSVDSIDNIGGTKGEDVESEGHVFDTPGDSQDAAPTFAGGVDEKEIWLIDDENGIAGDSKPPASPRPASEDEDNEVFGGKGVAQLPQNDGTQKEGGKERKEGVLGLEKRTSARAKTVPTIDLHAASIEVVEDYLEDDTSDLRLQGCCSMVVSHPGRENADC